MSFAKRSWSFHTLGFGTDRYLAPRGFAQPGLRYRLPRAVHQGRQGWWLIHLHLRVHLDFSAPAKSALIAASVDQVGCAYIRLDRVTRHGRSGVAVTTVGIVDGTTTKASHSPFLDVRFSNYLPFPGVRPGLNELLFIVPPSTLIRQIDVLPDSAFELSALSPARIALEAGAEAARTRVGRAVRISGTVRNLGLRTANRVGVSLDAQPSVFTVLGPSKLRIGEVRHGQVRSFTFTVQPNKTGRVQIGVSAQSSSNQTATVAYLRVTPTATGHSTRFWAPFLESLVAAALVVAAALTARSLSPRRPITAASFLAGLLSLTFWLGVIGATITASFVIAAGTSLAVLLLGARRGRGGWITAALIAFVAVLANVVLLVVLAAAGGQ